MLKNWFQDPEYLSVINAFGSVERSLKRSPPPMISSFWPLKRSLKSFQSTSLGKTRPKGPSVSPSTTIISGSALNQPTKKWSTPSRTFCFWGLRIRARLWLLEHLLPFWMFRSLSSTRPRSLRPGTWARMWKTSFCVFYKTLTTIWKGPRWGSSTSTRSTKSVKQPATFRSPAMYPERVCSKRF